MSKDANLGARTLKKHEEVITINIWIVVAFMGRQEVVRGGLSE